jgi:hypothetical protein
VFPSDLITYSAVGDFGDCRNDFGILPVSHITFVNMAYTVTAGWATQLRMTCFLIPFFFLLITCTLVLGYNLRERSG